MEIYDLNKILGSKSKMQIILYLFSSEIKCHCGICFCDAFNLSQPNLSKHLKKLIKSNIIDFNRHGKNKFYYLNQQFLKKWKDVLQVNALHNVDAIDIKAKNQNCRCKNGK